MTRILPALIITLTVAAFTACEKDTNRIATRSPMVAAENTIKAPERDPDEDESVHQTQMILRSDLELVTILEASLDDEPSLEQIVAFQVSNSTDGQIYVGVIDYEDTTASWKIVWESATQAKNPATLEIILINLVDDLAPEIVIRGTTDAERQTLDAYRRTTASEDTSLTYRQIAQISTPGTLEIGDTDGKKDNVDRSTPVPLIAHETVEESAHKLDLLRLTYGWDAEREGYYLLRTDPITMQTTAAELPDELYSNLGADSYEKFLAGPWYYKSHSEEHNSFFISELLVFSPDERTISIYDGDILEQFEWIHSRRPLLTHLDVWVQNMTTESLRKKFNIQAKSSVEIRVEAPNQNSYQWSYRIYRRLTQKQQEEILARKTPVKTTSLNGLYRSGNGISINFIGDRFVWANDEKVIEGGFTLRGNVLSMKVVGPYGNHQAYLTFRVDQEEISSSQRIERSLRLTHLEPESALTRFDIAPVLHLIQLQEVIH